MGQRWSRLSRWGGVLAALVLACGGRELWAAPAPLPKAGSPPLPWEVVQAWQQAGALEGWVGNHSGLLVFRSKPEGLTDVVPAFQFSAWQVGLLGKLSAPQAPFGLYLRFTPVTDAQLKSLAGLKSLHTLHLRLTKVTDLGMKELTGLKSLRTLHLADTTVTDAGLKELQKVLPGCKIRR